MIGLHEPSQIAWQSVCDRKVYEVPVSLLDELFRDTGLVTSQFEFIASENITPPPML
jgi:hypothetical protein